MSEINQIYVGENKEFFTIADTAARNQIANLDRVVVTPLPSHPQIATGDTIDTAFSKTEAQFEALGDMAFKDNLTKSDVTSALNYDPEAKDNEMKQSFQAGVDMMVTACRAKGSTPAGDPPYTPQAVSDAIMAIQTGGNYGTLEVNADGTYDVSQDPRGLDAYNIVVVSKDVGQPHTVVFYGPEQTIIKTQTNVPYHGFASCTSLDGTTYNGQYFKGQNPSPSNVITDMVCYPEYGDYIIDPVEIEDSQETICAKRGADYPLTSKKLLLVTIPSYTLDFDFQVQNGSDQVNKTAKTINVGSISVATEMVKVAEGEDGSGSTQISANTTTFGRSLIDYTTSTGAFGLVDENNNLYRGDQGSSAIRRYLNSYFLQNLPICLRDNIIQVNKAYIGYSPLPCETSITPSGANKSSLDKIQVPSKKELQSKIIGYTDNSFCGYEINGIDYSAVYNPTLSGSYSGDSLLRSSGHNGYNDKISAICITEYAGGGGYGSMDFGDSYANTTAVFGFCL